MRKPLGEILVQEGACDESQIEDAIRRQRGLAARNHYRHIGAILLEMGAITVQQLHRALEIQQASSDQAGSGGEAEAASG